MESGEELRLPSVRLYAGEDEDLMAWLEGLGSLRHGARGKAIKAVLRRGLARGGDEGRAGRGAVVSEASSGELLSEIRHVMEAVLEGALGRLTSYEPVRRGAEAPAEPAVDAVLARLGRSLMLDEDEA